MSGSLPPVRVEFYGLARHRAGRPAFMVEAETVGQALAAADAFCPELRAVRDKQLSPEYLVSLGGRRFTGDLGELIPAGVAILMFGADAGG
jgi:molybdopterin converting factor small subunit